MKNIFENAYFGKPYKTREGKRAILIGFSPLVVALDDINNKGGYPYRVFEDGRINDDRYPTFETKFDLVSEWQEPINEEELDKLALPIVRDYVKSHPKSLVSYTDGFKAGYRKAKEI